VPGEIALTIAVEVELPDAAPASDGVFEYAGEDRLSPPLDVLRRADVDRQKPPSDRIPN
jgi:hypothetical protein